MKKKILALALVVCLAAIAIVGASLAYFTDNEQAVNTFIVGNVNIELTEEAWKAPTNAVPGIPYAKDPVVKNVGANDAWIRVDVTLSDAAAFVAAAEKHSIKDLSTIFTVAADFDSKWILAGEPVADTTNNTLTYSYYYKTLLAKDMDTGALFTAVTIPAPFNNADMAAVGNDFTITITAHAMQDANFGSVQDAFAAYVFEAKNG